MTHPVYSARLLSAKGIVRLRRIAKELGVKPKDGRTIQSHVDAIVAYQSSKIHSVKIPAQIKYSDGFEECEPESYSVISDGNTVCDGFKSYFQAESWIKRNGYELACLSPWEQYLEDLVTENKEVVDDYLFHDDIKMERGSGRDKVPQLVAV